MHIGCWGQKLLLGVGLTAAVLVVPSSASPGGLPLIDIEFEYSPTEGPPGTTIEFSGSCPEHAGLMANRVHLLLTSGIEGDPTVLEGFDVDMSDGSFHGALSTVSSPALIPGDYDLVVSCDADDQGLGLALFDFAVVAGPVTTTTTSPPTSSTSTTTASTTTVSVPAAEPAPTTQVQPTFTG